MIGDCVIGMIDGLKLEYQELSKSLEQNRDYNGFYYAVSWNLVLVWDPLRKIVDAGVNSPENFHNSKSTLWCDIYDHKIAIPDGNILLWYSTFMTSGKLSSKIAKLKETALENG